jgi:hypothetical protein
MFVTKAYMSCAGNIYFKGIRLSEKIIVISDIGHGWLHTFLNAITIIINQNGQRQIAGAKYYHNHRYNEITIKNDAKKIIKDKLVEQAKLENVSLDETWLNEFSNNLIEETYRDQLATIKNIQLTKLLL